MGRERRGRNWERPKWRRNEKKQEEEGRRERRNERGGNSRGTRSRRKRKRSVMYGEQCSLLDPDDVRRERKQKRADERGHALSPLVFLPLFSAFFLLGVTS